MQKVSCTPALSTVSEESSRVASQTALSTVSDESSRVASLTAKSKESAKRLLETIEGTC